MSSQLVELVNAHIKTYGVREAEFARRIGTTPQTVNAWRNRGVKALPAEPLLRGVAAVTGRSYATVLSAALQDCGYLTATQSVRTGAPGDYAPMSAEAFEDFPVQAKEALLVAADSIYGEVQEAFAEMKRLRKVPRKLWTDARTLRYLNAMAAAGRVFD